MRDRNGAPQTKEGRQEGRHHHPVVLEEAGHEAGGQPAIGDLAGEVDCGDGTWTPEIRDAYAERIITMLEPHITNIRSAAIETFALSPADLQAMNINLVGGDPYGGAAVPAEVSPDLPESKPAPHRAHQCWREESQDQDLEHLR